MIYDYYGEKGHDDLMKHWRKNPDDIGPSPGGAAAKLGVTRERVIQLVNEGFLDMHRVYRTRLRLRASEIYIGQRSIDAYLKKIAAGEVKTRKRKKIT